VRTLRDFLGFFPVSISLCLLQETRVSDFGEEGHECQFLTQEGIEGLSLQQLFVDFGASNE